MTEVMFMIISIIYVSNKIQYKECVFYLFEKFSPGNRIKTSWRTKQINPFHGEDIENEDVFIALVPTQSPNHGRTYSSTDNLDKKPS